MRQKTCSAGIEGKADAFMEWCQQNRTRRMDFATMRADMYLSVFKK